MKTKKYEEVNYVAMRDTTLQEIKRDFKIQTVFMIILVILALYICFKSMILARDYDILKQEKQELERLTETQSSMIADLKDKCRDLQIELENERFGGNIK